MIANYGAVVDYGTDIDVFICLVHIYDDAEVSIDFRRIGGWRQQIPNHDRVMTPEEELAAIGKVSIAKKRIGGSVEAEIAGFLTSVLHTSSIEVRKLRQTDLTPLF